MIWFQSRNGQNTFLPVKEKTEAGEILRDLLWAEISEMAWLLALVSQGHLGAFLVLTIINGVPMNLNLCLYLFRLLWGFVVVCEGRNSDLGTINHS